MSVMGSFRTIISDGTRLNDDDKLFFGSDDDFSVRYDSAENDLIFRLEGAEESFKITGIADLQILSDNRLNMSTNDILNPGGIGAINDFDAEAIIATVGG